MLLVQPSKKLPIIIGEYGPAASMTHADIIPRTAWGDLLHTHLATPW